MKNILLGGAYGYQTAPRIRQESRLQGLHQVEAGSSAKTREAPQAIPSPSASPTPTVSDVVTEITRVWEEDGPYAVKHALDVAFCETKWQPSLKNANSSATGLFQFIDSTWIRARKWMGEDANLSLRYDYKENIRTAKALYEMNKKRWNEWDCQPSLIVTQTGGIKK